MVLPSHRRRGIAAELMRALEQCARERSIRLLFLDTAEGAGGAQQLLRVARVRLLPAAFPTTRSIPTDAR